jgi:hypothetical protein
MTREHRDENLVAIPIAKLVDVVVVFDEIKLARVPAPGPRCTAALSAEPKNALRELGAPALSRPPAIAGSRGCER